MPSKALLKAAGVAWHMRTAERFGFDAVQQTVDLGRVMASVRQAIEQREALSAVCAASRGGSRFGV